MFKFLKSQKGAMFGLDARIALGIFAALSVGTGYTIVNVIKDTNKTTMAGDMSAIKTGYQNLTLNTGQDTNNFLDLVKDETGMFDWSGPYITMTNDKSSKYGRYGIIEARTESSSSAGKPAPCTSTDLCFMWLQLSGVPSNIAKAVDEHIDGKPADPLRGQFRIQRSETGKDTVYYRMQKKQ